MKVLDHGIQVEAREFLGVVERLAHRIGPDRVLVENLKVQLVRPPVTVCESAGPARNWALAFARHVLLRVQLFFPFRVSTDKTQSESSGAVIKSAKLSNVSTALALSHCRSAESPPVR